MARKLCLRLSFLTFLVIRTSTAVSSFGDGSFSTPQGLVGDKVPLDRWLRCLSENMFARNTLIIRSQGGTVETVLN
ncbi:hypothetical protein DER46DRAFT_605584 [Fusarium sp. MPI-SDFR-AT-0072]|nr:hypothetical protein DER46DRAFT_605584 [Fusarium sp. MPI-SDFR-AT-0072]